MEHDPLSAGSQAPILCGLDETQDADGVARTAEHVSTALRQPLVLLHVTPHPLVPQRPAATFAERREQAEAFERAGQLHTDLEPIAAALSTEPAYAVEFGDPARVLAAAAADLGAALLVAGRSSQSKMEDLVLGSTTAELARAAPCPVVIVPPELPPATGTTIVAGIDGSRRSVAVARVAARLAQRLGLRLVLVTVGQADQHAALEPALSAAADVAADTPREAITVDGVPAEVLAALGRSLSAQCLVIGSRGIGSMRTAVIGSTSSAVVGLADRPVVVVPDPAHAAGSAPARL